MVMLTASVGFDISEMPDLQPLVRLATHGLAACTSKEYAAMDAKARSEQIRADLDQARADAAPAVESSKSAQTRAEVAAAAAAEFDKINTMKVELAPFIFQALLGAFPTEKKANKLENFCQTVLQTFFCNRPLKLCDPVRPTPVGV